MNRALQWLVPAPVLRLPQPSALPKMKRVGEPRMKRKILMILVVLTVTLASIVGRSQGATETQNSGLRVTDDVLHKRLTLPDGQYNSPTRQGLNPSSRYAEDLQRRLNRMSGFLTSRRQFAALCLSSDSLLARPCLTPRNQPSSALPSIPSRARLFQGSHFLISTWRGRLLRISSTALVIPSSLRRQGVAGVVIVLEVADFPGNLSVWNA